MSKASFDFGQRGKKFFSSGIWTKCGAHPSSLTVGASASFSEDKVGKCEADHSPPSSAEVKKE
jgi:hypothetical protein